MSRQYEQYPEKMQKTQPIEMKAVGGETQEEREWEEREAFEWDQYLTAFSKAVEVRLAAAEEDASWPNDGKLADGSVPEYRWEPIARRNMLRKMFAEAETWASRHFVERRWRKEVKTLPAAEWSEETLFYEHNAVHSEKYDPERAAKCQDAWEFRAKNGHRMKREWAGRD